MLRIAAAAIAGYALSAILAFGTDAIVAAGGGTRAFFSFINLLTAFPYGIAGGRVAARIARDREMAAAIGAGVLSFAMSAFFLFADPGNQPLWYWAALMASLAGGEIYGGYLRLRYRDRTEGKKRKKKAAK